ncbi:hypothetical protein KI387_006682, partial [Taxus chinensis]
IAAWELALALKRPLKTGLYELHTIYEEENEEESTDSQITRFDFKHIVILM